MRAPILLRASRITNRVHSYRGFASPSRGLSNVGSLATLQLSRRLTIGDLPRRFSERQLFSSAGKDEIVDIDAEIEAITDLYATAKDELDYALESKGTVYYNEEKKTAHEAVDAVLARFDSLLERVSSEGGKNEVKRRIGLRIEELKAQFDQLMQADLTD
ncbi:hypothetical protein M427DRAFT_64114 [Gonapodya prolifera JEL478]|uniref:Uncharacterized protein n=1 Tax=Gonapodya prolifera (strain JEL478) TaxID=1344416 RepID=A0A138ZY60_GONPJ|nr:hypothetical protein M427DRAFT_64114 [Gonapodya prolifera JEL478]|eukprot:KXS09442.1 hypothetical protein M427DRAFT_64114 [Gonapodya prolifera JEL478]